MEITQGDLLESSCDIIVQQINCICVKPKGLSKAIADKYPYANFYSKRRATIGKKFIKNLAVIEDRGVPGEIIVGYPENPEDPIVIGILGQYDYGKVNMNRSSETSKQREKWFAEGLEKILIWTQRLEGKKSIGFPFMIGCGLAGGNWENYSRMLDSFSGELSEDIESRIFKLK